MVVFWRGGGSVHTLGVRSAGIGGVPRRAMLTAAESLRRPPVVPGDSRSAHPENFQPHKGEIVWIRRVPADPYLRAVVEHVHIRKNGDVKVKVVWLEGNPHLKFPIVQGTFGWVILMFSRQTAEDNPGSTLIQRWERGDTRPPVDPRDLPRTPTGDGSSE